LTRLGQAPRGLERESQGVQSAPSPTSLDLYRRRVQLRHALVAVESAIVLKEERAPEDAEPVNLEGLRQDLLVALWLTEVLLSRH